MVVLVVLLVLVMVLVVLFVVWIVFGINCEMIEIVYLLGGIDV